MAKDKLTDYDSTASNNTDVGGISVAEGMLPSGVNNAIREQMSHLADFAAGTSGVDVLKLQDDTDTNSIKLQAPSSVTTTTTFTMPDGDGSADQVLKTDGSGQLDWADRHANPSLIINGAMTVNQRGDSTGVTSTGYYGPDRYQLTLSSLGTWSISQSSTAPSGFGNSYKLEATTADASPAASDYAIFLQKLEGQNLQQLKKGTASAESVTLSFWVRSSKTGTYIVELFDNDNSRSISASYTISVADTFEYKTITFAGDTTGAFDNDNASSMELVWWLAAGTDFTSGTLNTSWGTRTNANIAVGQVNMADTANATWYITGVKLEVGASSTTFIHEDYGTTLAKCQRYYQYIGKGENYGHLGLGIAYNTTGIRLPVQMRPVGMRTIPSITSSGSIRTAHQVSSPNVTGVSIATAESTNNIVGVNVTVASGLTQGYVYGITNNNDTNAYIAFSAEL